MTQLRESPQGEIGLARLVGYDRKQLFHSDLWLLQEICTGYT
jgi:hypothetical protein